MVYIQKRSSIGFRGLLNGGRAPRRAVLVKMFRNTLGGTPDHAAWFPYSFQPRLRSTCQRQGGQEDSSQESLSPGSPRALSGHGYEDHSQGVCTMPFPCSERDGDSLAPGNQADGQESAVTGCSEGQGNLGPGGIWAEVGSMSNTCSGVLCTHSNMSVDSETVTLRDDCLSSQ